ncbi:protein suppressor of gene silencing 3 [Phtheirospermum japonicum]|uniref:Protein suppressor of gene silencing 3 n=1 Tax=Phtheirospermum japonicum TaxID=374723 RepID=A0A830B141_9LAMI|nr:protein suppressor of gene silencing 3 [Phtheirospermum japonicum]
MSKLSEAISTIGTLTPTPSIAFFLARVLVAVGSHSIDCLLPQPGACRSRSIAGDRDPGAFVAVVELFHGLDDLTVEQINEPKRQWHFPACKGGPGATDWYRGLLPVISHAKTKRSKMVKLHRKLADFLDEELKRRGTSAVPAGEAFGKRKGLKEFADKQIIWPPMVVIMNSQLERDENEKWIGMGNQELLDYFSAFSAVRACHSYGPQGHRGMSVLIFEALSMGYAEAERLSKQFEDNCRDRLAWERNRMPFYSGGKRQHCGYMAEKQDMDSFNHHSQGKSKLKYEMPSYQEMVVKMKQMSEDNQQLAWLKLKGAKEQNKKALEESLMSEKLRQPIDENRVVKLKTKRIMSKTKKRWLSSNCVESKAVFVWIVEYDFEIDNQEQFYREHRSWEKGKGTSYGTLLKTIAGIFKYSRTIIGAMHANKWVLGILAVWHLIIEDNNAEKSIVWPPMVGITNTKLGNKRKNKWSRIRKDDLCDRLGLDMSTVGIRHSFGPWGHKNLSMVVFEASLARRALTEELSNTFKIEGRDRVACERPLGRGGQLQRHFYGYMAEKQNMDDFNRYPISKGTA